MIQEQKINFIQLPVNDYDYLLKFLIFGDSNVGKSCMLQRFSNGVFPQGIGPSIGYDFNLRVFKLNQEVFKLQIWGARESCKQFQGFDKLMQSFQGIFLVFDVMQRSSFDNLKENLIFINQLAIKNVIKMLVANKVDKDLDDSKRQVSYEQAKQFAQKLNIHYLECSAKDDINIKSMFIKMTKQIRKTNPEKAVIKKQIKKQVKQQVEDKIKKPFMDKYGKYIIIGTYGIIFLAHLINKKMSQKLKS